MIGTLALITGIAAAGWIVGTRVQSPEMAASRAAPPDPSLITAPVDFRVLSTRVVDRGDVVPGASTTVNGPASESAGTVTGVFVEVGDQLGEGAKVVEVSGRPVFVFEGEVPAFRAMRPGMRGSDIDQLHAALTRVGCDTTDDEGIYGEITKKCVEGLYEALGYTTVPTGEDDAERLATAAATVLQAQEQLGTAQRDLDEAAQPPTELELETERIAVEAARRKIDTERLDADEQALGNAEAIDAAIMAANAELADASSTVAERSKATTDVDVAVRKSEADARTSAESLVAADEALRLAEAKFADLTNEPDVSAKETAVEQASASLERAETALADLEARTGPIVPLGELVFVDTLPATVSTLNATVGLPVGAAAEQVDQFGQSRASGLVVLATADLQVEAYISPSDTDHLAIGMDVTLTDDISGNEITGTLAELGEQMETSSSGDDRGFLAVIEPDEEMPRAWTGRNVRVTFTGAQTSSEVLVVPSAALSAGADGTARVQVEDDDGTVRTVPVEAGLSADGFVEITPLDDGAVEEGDLVVVGTN